MGPFSASSDSEANKSKIFLSIGTIFSAPLEYEGTILHVITFKNVVGELKSM